MKRHSTYHHMFARAGATFVDRLGFAAPISFTTTELEHNATRNSVGFFDVYYQVAIQIAGRDAAIVLSQALVADTQNQPVGRVVYAAPCNERGGMIDDLTCFRLSEDCFWLFPTPSRCAQAMQAVQSAVGQRHATVTNLGYKNAYISVQGPNSRELLQGLTSTNMSNEALPYFSFTSGTLAEVPDVLISRTGYSGELGYELFYPSEYAEHMLGTLMDEGKRFDAQLCGLGALRTLRIEKRYPLYGLDLNETTTPFEAGVGWTVKLNKETDFVGKSALARQKAQGVERRLVLITMEPDVPLPAIGAAVIQNGVTIGKVTSADMGHSVGHMLAMAYVPTAAATGGGRVHIEGSDGEVFAGTMLTQACYDPVGLRVRS